MSQKNICNSVITSQQANALGGQGGQKYRKKQIQKHIK